MTAKFCKTCGAPLTQKDACTWTCDYCHNIYSDKSVKDESEKLLRALLNEQKIEQVSNLRRNIYDAINEKYTDSELVCRLCTDLKNLLPDDFMANFYYTANHGTPKDVCEAIRSVDAEENIDYIEGIIKHITSSMRSEYALPLQNLVERAFKNTDIHKFEDLSTLISSEVEKINTGMYETAVPRSAFIAYSSKDMPQVEELVEYLEANGLDCFVAARNLRHGRGAVQNYEKALHEAIDSCECIVFVSSQNSRSMECDAVSVELKYIKGMDIANAPAEYKKSYTSIPYRYKKNRVEYRIDNEQVQPFAEKVVSEFFSGLEYACSPVEVADRIYNLGLETEDNILSPSEAPTASNNASPEVKYCTACGSKNAYTTKFCVNCRGSEFVNSLGEYELAKKLKDALEAKEKLEKSNREREKEKLSTANKKTVSAVATEKRYFYFRNFSEECSISLLDKEKAPESLVFPSENNGKRVDRIEPAQNNRNNCNTTVKNVVIPDGVTAIHAQTFYSFTNLETVSIADSVTHISDMAFSYCTKLTSISLPANLLSIGSRAFEHCKAIKKIEIPESVTTMKENPFVEIPIERITIAKANTHFRKENNCIIETGTEKLIAGDKTSVIPEGIKIIGSLAFYDCDTVNSIYIPNSVTSIEDSAFLGCSALKKIIFGGTEDEWDAIKKGDTYINDDAVVVFKNKDKDSDTPTDDSYFSFSLRDDGTYEIAIDVDEGLFSSNDDNRHIQAPKDILLPNMYKGEEVTALCENAFYNCKQVKRIIVPDGIKYIGQMAFSSCPNLCYVSLPSSIGEIESYIFFECKSLKEVNYRGTKERWDSITKDEACIPEGVLLTFGNEEYVEKEFVTNKNVFEFTLIANKEYIITPEDKSYAPASIFLPATYNGKPITEIASKAFSGEYRNENDKLKFINIPKGYKRIGKEAFTYCSEITSITIPETVTEICESAFSDCVSLKDVILSEGLTEIGQDVFSSCTSLENITLPESVTKIGFGAFSSCRSMTEINIPKRLTRIEDYTFYAAALTNITIPKSITYIGKNAFGLNSNLNTITYEGTKAEWKTIKKGGSWKPSASFKVVCSDGVISKLFA